MSDEDVDISTRAFRDKLENMKQVGCALLLTGNVSEAVSRKMSRKLFGEAVMPRTRVLALADQQAEAALEFLPGDLGPNGEDVYVTAYDCDCRTTSATSSGAELDAGQTALRRGRLDDFRAELCNALATAKIARSGFRPAELRVSVFTLSYLLNRHDAAAVERFVTGVGDHVRGASGMAHFHLPMADDARPVQRLAPLFDARIELREKHGQPEQRWHFPAWDAPTNWSGL